MMKIGRFFQVVSQLCVVVACGLSTVTLASSVDTPTYQRIIVKYKENQSPDNNRAMFISAQNSLRAALLKRLSEEVGESLSVLRKLHTGGNLIELKQPKTPAQLAALLEQFQADDEVEYAEPDVPYHAFMVPNDSRYNDQWGLFNNAAGSNIEDAWDLSTGDGVVVAVLDSGYLPHVDLVDNLLTDSGYDFIGDTNRSADGDGRDADASDPGDWSSANYCYSGSDSKKSSWHGTHVAGTIAAVTNNGTGVAGVAYDAKILPVRVLGRCGGWMSDFADALIWAAGGSVSGVAPNSHPAQVINMSLGGSGACTRTMQNAVDTARSLGATVIVAAGNDNRNAADIQPGNCQGVINVGATNSDGERASYSNYGDVIDISAPGGNSYYGVLSTLNSGRQGPENDSYAFYKGTSMAAPHVAGVAALMYAMNPSITPTQVETILTSTAKAFTSACNQCGAGLLDAHAALLAVQSDTTSDTTDDTSSGTDDTVADSHLQNGVAITNFQLTQGERRYYTIDIPANTSRLVIEVEVGQGDVDLYVKYNEDPTLERYDCYSAYYNDSDETCTITSPNQGSYHIMLYGYEESSGLSLKASY